MQTPAAVRKMKDEYGLSLDAIAHFADVSNCTVSKYLRGVVDVSDDVAERIECAVSAIASVCHYYNLPNKWSEVQKLEPIVRRYMREHRAYLTAEERAAVANEVEVRNPKTSKEHERAFCGLRRGAPED